MATDAPIATTKNGLEAHSPFKAAPSPVTPTVAVVDAVPTDVMPRACSAAAFEPKVALNVAIFSALDNLVIDKIETCVASSNPFSFSIIPDKPVLLFSTDKISPIILNCINS